MSAEIKMPKLSDTMEEGKILRWLKKPGDRVESGDVIAEVETDKADMELEAFEEGVLDEVLVNEGDNASVGDVIARLRGDGTGKEPEKEEPKKGRDEKARKPKEAKAPEPERDEEEGKEKSKKAPAATEPKKASPEVRGTTKEPSREASRPAEPPKPGPPRSKPGAASPEGEARVSPAAEELATEMGVDPSRVTGTGPAGRVVRRDVERHLQSREERAKRSELPSERQGQREKLSNIRRTVAHRMAESKRETPHFYMTAEIDMEECARLRDGLEASLSEEPRVNFTHFLIRACALALVEHPRVNARYLRDDAIEYPDGVHVGLAVALDEGLIVAVLHDCDRKGLFEMAGEARELVERVRAGKFHGDDLTGGTFTISNLGMFPIEDFSAVINPPQAAVLAVGAVAERPVVRDGALAARKTMRVTLSSDHRVIDGIEAARFLERLKDLLENPLRLLLDRG